MRPAGRSVGRPVGRSGGRAVRAMPDSFLTSLSPIAYIILTRRIYIHLYQDISKHDDLAFDTHVCIYIHIYIYNSGHIS